MEKRGFNFKNAVIANSIGMLVTLTFGTAWLKIAADLSWSAAFAGGFTPFILVGLIKASLASWIGVIVRNRLISARLLFSDEKDQIKSA